MSIFGRGTRRLFKYFVSAYPGRTIIMIVLMTIAGVAEGIGVLALIPVLEVAEGGSSGSSALGQAVMEGVQAVGLQPTLGSLLIAIVGMITLKSVVLYAALLQVGYTTAHVSQDLRLRLIRALLNARWGFVGEQAIGGYAASIDSEANRAASAYREGCYVVAAFLQIGAYLAIAAAVSWQIALAAVLLGLVLTLFLSRFFSSSRAAGVSQTQHNKSLSRRLMDVLQGIKPLKAMAKESLVWPLLKSQTEQLNEAHRKQVLAAEGLRVSQEPIITLFLTLGLYLLLEIGNQPLSQVIVLAFVFYRIMRHVNTLQTRYQVVLVGEGAFSVLMDEIEEAEAEREVRSEESQPVRLRSGIHVEDVSFAYGEKKVLRSVDLKIPAGEFVALVGESGSGKTTLADLVVGLREPDEGRVLIDGQPLDEIDAGSWRSSIGYVPQELLLFHDTVYQNVTLGDESVGPEDVERALRLAGAWGFVQDMPLGVDHVVGERGSSLSGGQRQRIAIARALATRPTLLVLDEVTTALDPETEREICQTLRTLAGEVTILAISHQPALREVADVVYSLRSGELWSEEQRVESTASGG